MQIFMITLGSEGSDVGSFEKEGKKCSLGSFRTKFSSQDPTLYEYLTELPNLFVEFAVVFSPIFNIICPICKIYLAQLQIIFVQ